MRGLRRKDIEKYVDAMFPMLSEQDIYHMRPSGQIVLGPECKRALVQRIKRNYGKKRRGEL